jgi:hypothetical protein
MPNTAIVKIAALAGLALASAPAAQAQDDVMSGFYGNTLISKDGAYESHYHYNPDHTFTDSLPAYFMVLKGTWSEDANGQVCRVFSVKLPGVKNPDCNMMQVHKVGDVESEPNGDSEKLVSGQQ